MSKPGTSRKVATNLSRREGPRPRRRLADQARQRPRRAGRVSERVELGHTEGMGDRDQQLIVVAPVGVLKVPPMQLALFVAGVELLMVTPAGRLSVMEKLVRLVSAGAVMSIRSLEFCPGSIVLGLNDLEAAMPVPTG